MPRNKKILIVEDEQLMQDALRKKLEIEGLEVLQAFNGKEALGVLAKHKIDLILLDIIMPVMDGIKMLKQIKNVKKYKGIKVIILTNLIEYPSAKTVLSEKEMPYLVKSNYTLQEIINKVKATLNI